MKHSLHVTVLSSSPPNKSSIGVFSFNTALVASINNNIKSNNNIWIPFVQQRHPLSLAKADLEHYYALIIIDHRYVLLYRCWGISARDAYKHVFTGYANQYYKHSHRDRGSGEPQSGKLILRVKMKNSQMASTDAILSST